MVRMTARFENMDAVERALQQYGKAAEREISNAVKATGLVTVGGIQKRIQRGPKTGQIYTRRGITHRASAPGEAPATDTGTLVSSITFKMAEPLTAEIESRLEYATYLEFGTMNMAARPAWVPEVEARQGEFKRRVEDAIRKVTP